MAIMRWNPWGRTESWLEDLERWLPTPWELLPQVAVTRVPQVEVLEEGNDLLVRADLPGFDPANLDVRITEDRVTIRGERREERRAEQQGYYRSERHYGSYARSIDLPCRVDAGRATASYRNGVLEVRAPKLEDGDGQGRRLPIQTH